MNNYHKGIDMDTDRMFNPPATYINSDSTLDMETGSDDTKDLSYYFRFGWILLYPLAWLLTVILKIKNRRLADDDHYLVHQKEFFSLSRRIQNAVGRDFLKPSDKFYKLRPIINEYAFSSLDMQPLRMLDVATGCGYQAKSLKDAGANEVYGIDIVPERIDEAIWLYSSEGIQFLEMDAADLIFPDHYFDAAVVSFALHDMPTRTKNRVLRELKRVTKPGGNVVICEPRTFGSKPLGFFLGLLGELLDESINIKEYVMDDLNPILIDHGFEIVEEQNVSTFNLLNIKLCRVGIKEFSAPILMPAGGNRGARSSEKDLAGQSMATSAN